MRPLPASPMISSRLSGAPSACSGPWTVKLIRLFDVEAKGMLELNRGFSRSGPAQASSTGTLASYDRRVDGLRQGAR
jgi:hypothetical protein